MTQIKVTKWPGGGPWFHPKHGRTKTNSRPYSFTWEFYHTFKEKTLPILHILYLKIDVPSSICEESDYTDLKTRDIARKLQTNITYEL